MAEPVSQLDDNDARTWRAHWDRARPVLEKLRNEELRRMTNEERRRTLDALLQIGYQFRRPKSIAEWADFNRRVLERFG